MATSRRRLLLTKLLDDHSAVAATPTTFDLVDARYCATFPTVDTTNVYGVRMRVHAFRDKSAYTW